MDILNSCYVRRLTNSKAGHERNKELNCDELIVEGDGRRWRKTDHDQFENIKIHVWIDILLVVMKSKCRQIEAIDCYECTEEEKVAVIVEANAIVEPTFI